MNSEGNILQVISGEMVKAISVRHIPQSEIARLTGKNKGTISRIFSGAYAFSLDDIKLISNQLGIPVIGIITRQIYGESSPDIKKLLNTLESAEKALTQNMAELQTLKNTASTKAAS